VTYTAGMLALLVSSCVSLAVVPWRLGVVGDTQARRGVGRAAAVAMRSEHVELVAHVGDLWECASRGRWVNWRRRFAPALFAIGNHELKSCRSGRHELERFRRLWAWTFLGTKLRTWHARVHRGWRLVFLDSATPGIGSRQLAWARRELRHERVLVFSHRGLPCRSCGGRWWRRMDAMPYRWRNRALWRALHATPPCAAFHGHWHGYRAYSADGLSTWCTGGGGGKLAGGQRYHWLLVTMWGDLLRVERRLINARRKRQCR
jgi:hypothetical protein